jgi:putative membrane protein insertion efficiency factor
VTPLAFALSLPVRLYRVTLSPLIGHHCRFQPTCSAYALEALERHGALRGGWMTLRRLARCHPFGGDGYDPVPKQREARRGRRP